MLAFKLAIFDQCQCILLCVRILLANLTPLSTTSETLSHVLSKSIFSKSVFSISVYSESVFSEGFFSSTTKNIFCTYCRYCQLDLFNIWTQLSVREKLIRTNYVCRKTYLATASSKLCKLVRSIRKTSQL